eukprot:UN24839
MIMNSKGKTWCSGEIQKPRFYMQALWLGVFKQVYAQS